MSKLSNPANHLKLKEKKEKKAGIHLHFEVHGTIPCRTNAMQITENVVVFSVDLD